MSAIDTEGSDQASHAVVPFALLGRLIGVDDNPGADPIEGAVVVDRGKIVAIERPAILSRLPPRRFQAAFVAPGFIDLQINGGFGFEVGPDPADLRALAERLPETGVTAFLPTLVSRTEDTYQTAFAAYDAVAREGTRPGAARILGLHLEGPLLAPTRAGAHDRAPIVAATASLLDRLADPTRVRLITLAPERPDALGLIALLRARGIVVSLGHTDASFDIFTAGVDAGATLATHVFNAMSPFHHRDPGATGAALIDDRVIALMIADGVHTHPAALKLAIRAKGIDGLGLVTDAIAGTGLPPGPSRLAGRAVTVDNASARLVDGTLAGSTLTLDRAIRNMVAFADLSAGAAVHLATRVPARALGLPGLGRLAVSGDADVVLLNQDLGVMTTFVGGIPHAGRT